MTECSSDNAYAHRQGPTESVCSQSPLNPKDALRRRLLRRFNLWLDEMLDQEPAPTGVAAEVLEALQAETETPQAPDSIPDLYSQWSAVIAMTEETRLQGRSFKQLHNDLDPMPELFGKVSSVLQRSEQTLEQLEQKAEESAREAVLTEVLDVLIDIRDRLVRGMESARQAMEQTAPTARFRLVSRLKNKTSDPPTETVSALIKGYQLSADRLDELLSQYGVRPINCLGLPFDPASMKAVDIDSRSDAADGTVLEVYRAGYWRNNSVYRPAEVKVARRVQVSNS